MAKLYFYYSAMNAGKSTLLLQSAHNYEEKGMQPLILTPSLDTRYGIGVVASRLGITKSAKVFTNKDNLKNIICAQNAIKTIDCVLVDEAQFLTKAQVVDLACVVDELDIPVLTYGIRTDFMAQPFIGSSSLLAIADNLIEIKTICWCGKKATMNVRVDGNGKKIKEGKQIEIGGNERYVATCRKHFFNWEGITQKW